MLCTSDALCKNCQRFGAENELGAESELASSYNKALNGGYILDFATQTMRISTASAALRELSEGRVGCQYQRCVTTMVVLIARMKQVHRLHS